MAEEIEKFDPSKLMQGVKDRIKATFVSLIPDAKWDEMVQKEIDAFFNEKSKLEVSQKTEITGDYWQRKQYLVVETEQSPFRSIVWGHCLDMTYEILKEKINKEYFTNNWVNGSPEIADEMKKIVAEAGVLGATKFFESMSLGMMRDIQERINRMR